MVRIGKTWTGLARQRGFARIDVAVPRRADDGADFTFERLERGVGKTAAITLLEFLPRQFDGRHSLANIGLRHRTNSRIKTTEAKGPRQLPTRLRGAVFPPRLR